jgi:hypothetical protein
VLRKLQSSSITKSIIRNVKKKHTTRIDVINAMVEVALENKKQISKLKKINHLKKTMTTTTTNKMYPEWDVQQLNSFLLTMK